MIVRLGDKTMWILRPVDCWYWRLLLHHNRHLLLLLGCHWSRMNSASFSFGRWCFQTLHSLLHILQYLLCSFVVDLSWGHYFLLLLLFGLADKFRLPDNFLCAVKIVDFLFQLQNFAQHVVFSIESPLYALLQNGHYLRCCALLVHVQAIIIM